LSLLVWAQVESLLAKTSKDGIIFENQVNVETMKVMTGFRCGPTKVRGISLGPLN
jgi:hypothetical protein